MASTSSGTYTLIDRLLDGQLADKLRAWRNEDPRPSYDQISDRLKAEGFDVSRETVGRWCRDLDLPGTREPADAA